MFRVYFLFLVVFSSTLNAQSTFATLSGRVLDPQGEGIPGSTVRLTNEQTGLTRQTESLPGGLYEIGYLLPGQYRLSISAPGFQTYTIAAIHLSAAQLLRLDARMKLGDVATEVTVTASLNQVPAETGVIADVKTREQYINTAVNARGSRDSYVFDYMSFVPGAQPSTTQFNVMFGGTRAGQNNYTVDGVSSNSVLFGNVNGPAFPSMESIQEVRVNLSGNAAEFGHPGQVTVVTRGGSNHLHGSAFWYYGSAGLNARDFFATGQPFAVLHNAGGSLAGPLRRNRTFFLSTYEFFEDRTAAQLNLSLPNEAMRKGDYSQLRSGAGDLLVVRDPLSGAPLPGNVVPASRLSPTAIKIQERFYPLPNFGPPLLAAGNYRDYLKQRQGRQTFDARLDHQLTARNFMFVRGNLSRTPDNRLDSQLPTIGFRDIVRTTYQALVSDTQIFSPSLIHEFRVGLSFQRLPSGGPLSGLAIVRDLGLTNLAPGIADVPAVPRFNISGFTSIAQSDYRQVTDMIWQVQSNASWYRAGHTVKVGFDLWRNFGADYPQSPSAAYGTISFTGNYSGYPHADFLFGIPRQASRAAAGLWRSRRNNVDWNVFLQDEWKVSRRLTVAGGIRYSVNPPYRGDEDRLYNWNPYNNTLVLPNVRGKEYLNPGFVAARVLPLVVAADAGLPERTLVFTDWNNVAPRLGFAYRLTENGRTAFRGSYGIFYDLYTAQMWNALARGPFSGNETSAVNQIVNGVPVWSLPDLFPPLLTLGATAVIGGISTDYKNPMMQQWNATLEREQFGILLRASYVAMKSHGLQIFRNLNQPFPSTIPFTPARRPYPTLGTANFRENMGNAYYNGLILTAERRTNTGLFFQVSHTWSRNLTDAHFEIDDGGRIQNIRDRRADWAEYATNRRHRFVGLVQYSAPIKSRSGVVSAILRDWQMSSALVLQTGQWFHPVISGIDPANVGIGGSRPDRIGSGALSSPSIDRWFDVSAFVAPPNGRFGNAPMHFLEGPGTKVWNLAIVRYFQIREGLRLRLEGLMNNLTNTPNFGQPATDLANRATVGRITSTQFVNGAGARTTRLAVRWDF